MKKAAADFQVFVKPVGSLCNMACKYCYYLKSSSLYPAERNGCMTEALLEEYIVQHIKATTGSTIFFSWHGGEPTMAGLPYFQRIVELQRKHQPAGCHITNGLQTNGTLLDDDWCRFLAVENFVVGISLDGPEDLHSVYRGGKEGQLGFKETMRGYELLKSYGVQCEILCVVNAANVEQPLRVYRFFKSIQCEFITFLPLVERLPTGWNVVTESSTSAKAFGRFLCVIFDEWKAMDIGTVKVQIFEEALRTAFDQEHTLCIFKETCGGVPVLERNGDFYSCDHYVDSQHLIGNINQTPLVELLNSRRQEVFGLEKLYLMPLFCLNCDVRSMCNGGCPKDRFIKTPKGEPGLNYLCEGYKHFFKHCKPFVEEVAEVWRNEQMV
ncbi:MAG TPA: anaerobic sulfatase maturase [Prolixibacteraceae bacterium]|jgi:uncharacterized protein